jgi:ParB-like chromosome segregation protein Spo0J
LYLADPRSAIRDPRIEVVYRLIDLLRPDPRNARRHSGKQIRQIADSIRAFGFNVPILVDTELKVIAGHGRAKQAVAIILAAKVSLRVDDA